PDGIIPENMQDPRTRPGGRIKEAWPDAPVPDGAIFPAGASGEWDALFLPRTDGLSHDFRSRRRIDPLVITGLARDSETDQVNVTVAYRAGPGRWVPVTVPRERIADAQQVVALAGDGFPVTSTSARDVVDYRHRSEETTRAVLPVTRSTSRTGWHDDLSQFVVGRETLARPGVTDLVRFVGVDDGATRLAGGFRQSGSLDEWRH